MQDPFGFLAIWCDIGADDLDDYRNWLTQEHIADRTFSPGFLSVRLFEELDDPLSHFILYATANADVLRGEDYRRILDTPSAWTRRIMPKFGPFDRALGRQVLKIGNGFGAFVAVWQVRVASVQADFGALEASLRAFVGQHGVVSVRLFVVDHDVTGRHSTEKTMRSGREGAFDFLLCVEATSESAVRTAESRITASLPALIPELETADVSCRRMLYGEAAHEGAIDHA